MTFKTFLGDLVGVLWDRILAYFRWGATNLSFPLVTGVLGFLGLVIKGISSVVSYFNSMMAAAVAPTGQCTTLNAGTMLGIANYFVPLDMMFYCTSILLTLWLASVSYRFIKSWIPTVN